MPPTSSRLKTDRGTGYLDQGTGALLAWTDPDRMAARFGNHLHAAHGSGRGDARAGAGADGARRADDGGDRRPDMARRPARATANSRATWPPVGPTRSCSSAARAAAHGASQRRCTRRLRRPDRASMSARCRFRAGPLHSRLADRRARRDLWRRRRRLPRPKGFSTGWPHSTRVPAAPLAVLGFGDRGFPAYCAFAKAVVRRRRGEGLARTHAARHGRPTVAAGLRALGPRARSGAGDRTWSLRTGRSRPATERLTLVSRRDYGAEVQAPTAILRFALPNATLLQRSDPSGLRALRRRRPDRNSCPRDRSCPACIRSPPRAATGSSRSW